MINWIVGVFYPFFAPLLKRNMKPSQLKLKKTSGISLVTSGYFFFLLVVIFVCIVNGEFRVSYAFATIVMAAFVSWFGLFAVPLISFLMIFSAVTDTNRKTSKRLLDFATAGALLYAFFGISFVEDSYITIGDMIEAEAYRLNKELRRMRR